MGMRFQSRIARRNYNLYWKSLQSCQNLPDPQGYTPWGPYWYHHWVLQSKRGRPSWSLCWERLSSGEFPKVSGFMKCWILSYSSMFLNCRSCGLNFIQEKCTHIQDETALTSTWVIAEVIKAVEKGYEIQEVYEIWKYNTVQMSIGQEGFFPNKMKKCMQIKQQLSGW